ncbi:MAG: hypothetical protein K0S61_3749 [Anaerocolumna sp.]|jgi:hypothetical protein|nr:hypothetical protein [Anaerocolumna sp.]
MESKRYKRASTNITISIFYEQASLKKYNFDPPYQRDYNVWNDEQKSFLIDSIFKNFPMPPIFLEQKIQKGKTTFDVIDGKQRLTTIIEFIKGNVRLPNSFGDDIYGTDKINGLDFPQINFLAQSDNEINEYVEDFWGYVINVEYIDKPNEKVVDNIFDRLNRGGERLNPAELRKAKYYDTPMYQTLINISKNEIVQRFTSKLNSIRMQNISFITEVYLINVTGEIISGNEEDIDQQFDNKVEIIEVKESAELGEATIHLFEMLNSLNLDMVNYSIVGTSHTYALLFVMYMLNKNNISINEELINKFNQFFLSLRNHEDNNCIQKYSLSMQSATKKKYQRKRRIEALLQYIGYKDLLI